MSTPQDKVPVLDPTAFVGAVGGRMVAVGDLPNTSAVTAAPVYSTNNVVKNGTEPTDEVMGVEEEGGEKNLNGTNQPGPMKRKGKRKVEIEEEKDSDEEEGSEERQRSKKQMLLPTKEKAKGQLDLTKSYTFRVSPSDELRDAAAKRSLVVTGSVQTKDPTELALWQVHQAAKIAQDDLTYQGKGKAAKTIEVEMGITSIARLDKVNNKVNPRISKKGPAEKDRTTSELSKLIDKYEGEELLEFLAAVRGEPRKKDESKAFDDGAYARSVCMLSDAAHHPGNSALTERLLKKVNNKATYTQALIGDSTTERSYGAVPSQNRSVAFEDEFSRKTAYKAVGELVNGNPQSIGSAKTDLSAIRKVASISNMDPEALNIDFAQEDRKSKKAVFTPLNSHEEYQQYAKLKTLQQHDRETQAAKDEKRVYVSEGEEVSEDEAERMDGLPPDFLASRDETLEKSIKTLQRKRRAIKKARGKK